MKIQEKNENYSRRFNNRLTDLTLKKSHKKTKSRIVTANSRSLSQKASTNCVIRFLRIKGKQNQRYYNKQTTESVSLCDFVVNFSHFLLINRKSSPLLDPKRVTNQVKTVSFQ